MQQPQLDLRVLQYFVAVAEELHFGRAAVRLHIAQPSLSVQIRKLEHLLGTPLLIRTSRSVALTGPGDVLLGEAKRLISAAQRAVSLTREAASGVRGTLIVGFQANAAAELTPRILAAFKNNHPEIHVQMRSFDFTDPTAGLADGGADVAFVRPPLPAADWLAMETLFIEPRVLVVASSSRFAGLSEVSVEQVADEPFVARKAPDKWRDFWLATQARGGQPVRLGTQVATVDECFEAIMGERGIAFTQASTQRFYDRPGLSFIPVIDVPPSALSIAWRTDVNDGLAREFVETARTLASFGGVPNLVDSRQPASLYASLQFN
ncbi:MAG TPA: LysR family transcriptional regulator [Arthrobacter sp.]|jgi:DNA-binding transcriptional LysR family regulator